MVRRVPANSKDEVNGNEVKEDYVGTGSDHSMVFHTSDVLGLAVANVPDVVATAQNGLQLSLLPVIYTKLTVYEAMFKAFVLTPISPALQVHADATSNDGKLQQRARQTCP